MAQENVNPYESPRTLPEAAPAPHPGDRVAERGRRMGPAIYIVFLALIGAVAGIPLLANDNPVGFLTVFPGAVIGGLVYRLRARTWPIDPTAKVRRFSYAATVVFVLPFSVASLVGLGGQGATMALLALYVGVALAAGILISGDRRCNPPG